MKNTAPIWMGVAAIAGLVFIIATGVAYVLYDFPITSAVFVGVIVSGIAAVALFLGWAPPLVPLKDAHEKAAVTPDPVAEPVAAPKTAPAVKSAPAAEPTTAAEPTPVAEPSPVVTPDPVAVPQAAPDLGDAGKPVLLTAARDGGPDDLRQIKGVGPKLETMLHGMGVYHFDQIAAWTPAEEAWMDDNIEGFKGRVTRDAWVAQAKALVAGGAA